MTVTAKKINRDAIFQQLAEKFKDSIHSEVDGNLKALLKTFQVEMFGEQSLQQQEGFNEWLFESDTMNVRYVSEKDEQVIGHQAGIGFSLLHNNQALKAAWAIDMRVRPEWKMKVLGVAMIKHLMDNHDVVGALGVSDEAFGMLKRLGWEDLGQIHFYVKPLKWSSLQGLVSSEGVKGKLVYPLAGFGLGVLSRLKALTNLSYKFVAVDRFVDHKDAIEPIMAAQLGNQYVDMARSAEYLDWRFFNYHGEGKYLGRVLYQGNEALGYLVAKVTPWKHKTCLAISEILCDPKHYGAMLTEAERIARQQGADIVVYKGSHPELEAAMKAGFYVERPGGDKFMVYNKKVKEHQDHFLDRGRWRICFSESDMDFLMN